MSTLFQMLIIFLKHDYILSPNNFTKELNHLQIKNIPYTKKSNLRYL